MSGESDRISVLRLIPRILVHTLGWVLLCLSLQNVVPALWAWGAFPTAVAIGIILYRLRLKILPAGIIILIFPWLIRLLILAFSSMLVTDLPVIIDNGWFLTAPYLYFSAFFFFLSPRHSGAGYVEIVILAGFITLLSDHGNLWTQGLSDPVADSVGLLAAALLIILSMLSFAGLFRDGELRLSGYPTPRRGRRLAIGSLIHWIILASALILLILVGNNVRRDQSIQSGGGLLASDMFRFDFSDVLSLEPEISLNAEITMLYREDGPATVRHLRRYTLSGWDEDRGFFRDGDRETDILNNRSSGEDLPIPVTIPKGLRSWPAGGFLARTDIRQEYYLIALDPESFFSLNYPISVEPWTIWDDASFTRAYAADSRVSIAGPWELMDIGETNLDRETLEYYLQGGDDPYFIGLSESISGDLQDRWSKVSAVEQWFHKNYYYSLKPGLAPDGDQLSWFLKETRRGYCSYFAFAMTRICRAAGIPARVAVGFLTDPQTSTLGFVPVRSDQAHAWVEVWFDEYGWITFDPTSDVMAPGEDYPFEFLSPDEWLSLIEEVLTRSGEVSIALEEDERQIDEETTWWRWVADLAGRRPVFLWITLLIILLAVYLPFRIIPGTVRLFHSASRRRRRRCLGYWRLFSGRLTRAGYGPTKAETPLAWAIRMENNNLAGLEAWTRLYLKAEYSSRFDIDDAKTADVFAAEAVKSWRAKPVSRRLRAFFGPGWRGAFPW